LAAGRGKAADGRGDRRGREAGPACVVAMRLTVRKERQALMDDQIRSVLAEHGRLPVEISTLGDDDDLYRAGMTSHASVNVMLALEEAFDIEFPEAALRKSTFESVSAIRSALTELEVESELA
jgi:acyl carrier protein